MKVDPSLSPQHPDLEFCWGLILHTRPNFGVSQSYVAPEYSVRLVALYALLASLEELFCRVTDEQVARTKLAWWQVQLLGPEYTISAHPVTRQLRQSGAITTHVLVNVKSLLNSIAQRLDLTAVADETELRSLCVLVALDQMKLELSLQGTVPGLTSAVEDACAVMGLTQLMRESSRAKVQDYNWVPLTLLAHCGVNRSDLVRDPDSAPARKMRTQLCVLGLNWLAGSGGICKDSPLTFSLPNTSVARHWLIQFSLCVRLLRMLPGKTKTEASRLFSQSTAGDAWCAWRCARKLLQEAR